MVPKLAFCRGHNGLSRENTEKCLKGGSRSLSAPGPKKLEKVSQMNMFQVYVGFWLVFETSFRLFWSFLDPGAENPFSDLSSEFSREAFLTPVEGRRCPNAHDGSKLWFEIDWSRHHIEVLFPYPSFNRKYTPFNLNFSLFNLSFLSQFDLCCVWNL